MAMKAKASGMPAKLEATPEKVITAEREPGRLPLITASAMANPQSAPKQGRGERYADRNPVGGENLRLNQIDDVLKREMPVLVDEGARRPDRRSA